MPSIVDVVLVPPRLRLGGTELVMNRPLVMGVVNASPESFSDGRRFRTLDDQLRRCDELITAGADIVDVGGQSAITNQPELDPREESARVVPIVDWLSTNHPDQLVSVDTYKPAVVEAVLSSGASIINDVSGLADARVAQMCAAAGAALVIMHTRAAPKVRRQEPDLYVDVVRDVVDFLAVAMRRAIDVGLARDALILDPGPDFTKTPHQTVAVLRRLDEVRALGRPMLLALSRKDFLGAILGTSPRGRDVGTLAAIAYLASAPGDIVRVHDVAATHDVLRTIDVLSGRANLDPSYLLPDDLRYEPPPR